MAHQEPPRDEYLLGQQHLSPQAQLLNPFTRRLLVDAGISAGMRVLDLGCGPGDVSLLAAELVGETGSVLGVDTNATLLKVAEARAHAAGLKHVGFQAGDIRDMPLPQEFDAIVGRLILMHLREPADLVRRLATHVRPGGVLAFQDFDLATYAEGSYPPAPLWDQATGWIFHMFQRAGIEVRMGMKYHSLFLDAGLPAPHLRFEAPMGSGPEWGGYVVLAQTIHAMLPLIERVGVATAEEVGIETLADRLRTEMVGLRAVAHFPALVGAWVRTPSA